MEDRYLFKAKKTDSEEWVIGSLISMPHGGYMIDRVADSRRFRVMINPSTICQCTGLKDKNGKLIWENDIVRRLDMRNAKEPSIGVIEYDAENTSFLIHWVDVVNYSATFPWKNKIKVIGNIFDNAGLLESEG